MPPPAPIHTVVLPPRNPPGASVYAGSTDPNVPAVTGVSVGQIVGGRAYTLGSGPGVVGRSESGIGVEGTSDGIGVFGKGAPAGHFESSRGVSIEALGLADADAILATSFSPNHAAVAAHNSDGGYGLWADSSSNTGIGGVGIYAKGAKYAAQFDGVVYCTGNMTVDGDIVLSAADCAEEFDITASREIEPGTVMVLTENGALEPSRDAYDKKVAGIISGAGDYRPGMILDRHSSSENRMPIALVGKVYCKVDAEYEPIQVGDLLTTSPTPGHAMKASNPLMAFGAVIGKALRPLRFGQGLVPVLVALQ